MNVFGQLKQDKLRKLQSAEKGESNVIVDSKGNKVSQVIPAGLSLMVKQGDTVKTDQALNMDPNAGGFGQEESEIVLQNPIRIFGYLAFCFFYY
jgi:apocytochrome f